MKKFVFVENISNLLEIVGKYITNKFTIVEDMDICDGFYIALYEELGSLYGEAIKNIDPNIYDKYGKDYFHDDSYRSSHSCSVDEIDIDDVYDWLVKTNKIQILLDHMEIPKLEMEDDSYAWYIPKGSEVSIHHAGYQDFIQIGNVKCDYIPSDWSVYINIKEDLSPEEMHDFYQYCNKHNIEFID